MLDFTIDLAHRAGAILRSGMGRERSLESKGYADVVSDIDRASEALIVEAIRAHFPEHGILAEEGGGAEARSAYTWVIDPLDGTLNYVHGFPYFCVSIALLHEDEPLIGVVYDPLRDELFSAERGRGARCNGRRLRVSTTDALQRALLTTGFPYERTERAENNLNEHNRVLMAVQDVRRAGAAALDLCYAAAGRSEGHWELGLRPWDVAAGALLVREAGGRLSDWEGRAWTVWNERLVASNGLIHEQLLALLNTER